VWLYGDPDAKKNTLAQTINVEHPVHQLDFRTFCDAYRDDTPILTLQLHPNGWNDRRFENFRFVITCLKEMGADSQTRLPSRMEKHLD
jgi:hypothetical protein